MVCEKTGKKSYSSIAAARKDQMHHGRRMRFYRCPHNPNHFHATKEFDKLR